MVMPLGYLTTLFGTATDSATATSGLLGISYGLASQSVSVSGQNPVTALNAAEKNQKRDVKVTSNQPAVKRAVDAFTAAVQGAKSVDQLLANPRALEVLLTANGLGDQVGYAALARKALTSNTKDPKSLANTLTDTRWKQVAKTYDFANKGLSIIKDPKVITTIADAYAEVTWRKSLDAATPGLANALAFRASASTISSADQILGDPVMRNVVTTTLGIPLRIAFQSLEAQEKAINTRVDVKKFADPKFVESFIQRYLIAAGKAATDSLINNSSYTTTTDLATLAAQARGLVV